jgi:type IX secretion system PorP/SprF family membrane protein
MRLLTVIFTLLLTFYSFSQNEIIINQSHQSIFSVNSSYSSLALNNEANLYYKKLWSGFADSPEYAQFTIFGPVKNKKIGLGLNLNRQQSGIFSYVNALGSLAYKVKLNDNNVLSFGLQAGVKRLQINFSKINALHPDEFIGYPTLQTSTLPTADFSVNYKHKSLLVFVSANQLLSGKFFYTDATYQSTLKSQVVPYYLLGTKWDKSINNQFANSVTLIIRSHQGLPVQAELSDVVTWNNKISLGLGYRQTYNAYVLGRVQLTNDLLIGYSYEYGVNRINKYSNGGHEINLSYKFGSGFKSNENSKKTSNKAVTELYEQIDKVDQKLEENTKRVDTLDKNVKKLNEDFKNIKKQSLNQIEIKRLVDSLKTFVEMQNEGSGIDKTKHLNNNKSNKRYGAIVNYEDADKYKNITKAKYNVVYGVFKQYNNAKEYIKLLARDHAINTELLQLEGSVNNSYYYVVDKIHKTTLDETVTQLKNIRAIVAQKTEPITNGLPWVLIMIEQ